MDAATLLALTLRCAPLVAPSTTQALVNVESASNPFAIGVVKGSLERQPRNAAEAIATARALSSEGRNYSIGLAQINVRNLDRLGLSLEESFDGCKNLGAMQAVLSECAGRISPTTSTQRTLRLTLSCYYSGNLSTGFRDGYVGRVVSASLIAARAPP